MQLLILFVFHALFLAVSPFQCSDIKIETQCTPNPNYFGCTWNPAVGECLGTFMGDCTAEDCFYVHPSSQTGIHDGSLENPFITLEDALDASLFRSSTEVILLNTEYDMVFQLEKEYILMYLPSDLRIRYVIRILNNRKGLFQFSKSYLASGTR